MKPMHLKKCQFNKRKLWLAVVSILLVAGCVAGGASAWLTSEKGPVTNVFVGGSDLEITLAESSDLDLRLIPGSVIQKDPVVTVKANSVESYLFVKMTETNTADYLKYTFKDDGWTELTTDDTNATYYCRKVGATTEDQSFYLLTGDETYTRDNGAVTGANGMVTVKETVTEAMIANVSTNPVSLKFEAVAIQTANLTLPIAFKQAFPDVTTTTTTLTTA